MPHAVWITIESKAKAWNWKDLHNPIIRDTIGVYCSGVHVLYYCFRKKRKVLLNWTSPSNFWGYPKPHPVANIKMCAQERIPTPCRNWSKIELSTRVHFSSMGNFFLSIFQNGGCEKVFSRCKHKVPIRKKKKCKKCLELPGKIENRYFFIVLPFAKFKIIQNNIKC